MIKTVPQPTKSVYSFGDSTADGDATMKDLLGGKGANLAEMCRIGLPVPPGFTISTEVCTYYYQNNKTYPASLQSELEAAVALVESRIGYKFGDATGFPLLVAVRSGARDSMPGMMDTILNLGLNDETVGALEKATSNPRFAWDCYRRFVQMYGDVVLGVQKLPDEDHDPFEVVIHRLKVARYGSDVEDGTLTADDFKQLVTDFKQLVLTRTGHAFPASPWDQLKGAIGAVFGSWMNDRAVVYRRKYGIPAEWGTAVSVQAMVFGNTGPTSGSGVGFTRDPATGRKVLYGEFLVDAQGEDVVAGVRTPQELSKLEAVFPEVYAQLVTIQSALENHFRDVQDFEFTIQDSRLFMLQTRNGKRTGAAAIRFAVEMEEEGLIDWKTAVMRVPAEQLDQVLTPVFDRGAVDKAVRIATGLPAGPGAASGHVYLNADRAEAAAARGEKVLLVRNETSPEDLRGMIASTGILTGKGGVSSHAALVARQMGKVCVCGASALEINYDTRTVTVGDIVIKEGDYMSIDGTQGFVYMGEVATAPSLVIQGIVKGDEAALASPSVHRFQKLMKWCDDATRMHIRTNADTPEQVRIAIAFGARGLGLTRTEHMFFEGHRIDSVRRMILAEDAEGRKSALAIMGEFMKSDFEGIFTALNGLPGTVRLLDPPLNEFLPERHLYGDIAEIAAEIGVTDEFLRKRAEALTEHNPMLGHRGCRLGISYPDITETQARAIFEAATAVKKRGIPVLPEVMVPLVGFQKELELQVGIVRRVAAEVAKETGVEVHYMVGTMIEIPRGALIADDLAKTAEFFSFGTNDLTQTTLGISRDDMGSFLRRYTEDEIFRKNPFVTLDTKGVGQLVEMAIAKGRSTRPEIELGICGEHGGDPESVKYCHRVGLMYASCSPYRVPTARLAAAQAAIEDEIAAAKAAKLAAAAK